MSAGTLLLSGTDLRTLCIVEDLNDFWSSSDLRGDLPSYPGVDGVASGRRPVASKLATGQISVTGDTLAETEDAVAAVKTLLRVGETQTVTRRKITGAGNRDATQPGIVRAPAERWQGDGACTLILGVELLDGVWYGASTNIASAAGAHTIAADIRTHRMTITLAAGAARTIANSTNGYYVQFLTTVPTGGVLIDVEARTAHAITGGADLSRYLQWGKTHPMQLDPGSNTLVLDAGSASIDYQPAYL